MLLVWKKNLLHVIFPNPLHTCCTSFVKTATFNPTPWNELNILWLLHLFAYPSANRLFPTYVRHLAFFVWSRELKEDYINTSPSKFSFFIYKLKKLYNIFKIPITTTFFMILQFLFAGAIVIYRSQFYDDIFRHCFASMEATNTEHSPTKNIKYCGVLYRRKH